jgi:ERCC4-related helicase
MSKIKDWWTTLWREEYQLIITVPGDTIIHADGSRTETTKDKQYAASKIIKTTPKIFIFEDLKGRRHEIKFLNPVDFHIIKIW